MTESTFLLVMLSALMHGVWNLLVKRSIDKQAFLWLALVAVLVIFFFPFILFLHNEHLSVLRYLKLLGPGWIFVITSGLVEASYYLLLGSAYHKGELSLVYPIARGSAPVFVLLFAVIFLGERLAPLGLFGIACVALGIFAINIETFSITGLLRPLVSCGQPAQRLALLTGLAIATYSVLDKKGVSHVPPHLFIYLKCCITVVALLPVMLIRKRKIIFKEWSANKLSIVAVALLLAGAYLLVLIAMTTTKVSYVSSVREISIVFSSLLGTVFLKEAFAEKKIPGALLIVVGIVLISMSK